jgi:recombinational DNA repair ATPase RecF
MNAADNNAYIGACELNGESGPRSFAGKQFAMTATPVDDIVAWASTKLATWRQDALRRLASSGQLTDADHDQLLAMVKAGCGLCLETDAPTPIPLDKTHFSSVSAGPPVRLKAIRNVKNVNRLVPEAILEFAPELTIVYGRNGSGKSGFVRILRTACRSRIEDPAKLRVLGDVYGPAGGPQEADLVIDSAGSETCVAWQPGMTGSDLLLQVGVFDSNAAQLYVDQGNQIQFLPFGLALPHKLNELCLALKERLEKERKPITEQIALAAVTFETARPTTAQAFCSKLSATTSDEAIEEACAFSAQDQDRLAEVNQVLASKGTTEADIRALAKWSSATAADAEMAQQGLSASKLTSFEELKQKATEARTAASTDAETLFSGEPLPGVGRDAWRVLWSAAKEYSVQVAYAGQPFPVVVEEGGDVNCLLCQQPLSPEASARLKRFQSFVEGALAEAAENAEEALSAARDGLPSLAAFASRDWQTRVEQIRKRNPNLAGKLEAFKVAITGRFDQASRLLTVGKVASSETPSAIDVVTADLEALAAQLTAEADSLASASNAALRPALVNEQAELADRKVLAASKTTVLKRRDLLKQDACYEQGLAEVHTRGITQKANELIDVHLTTAVTKQFDAERKLLDISHLKVGLARKSGQTKASFQTSTGVKLAKTSDILSEGEQRALALSAFLTEVVLMPGGGPIVVDDPVSSLDRERGLRVAERIVEEASKRQVVVFTHDLIFFNDLCRLAEDRVGVKTIGLFSDGANAGLVDPAGVAWQGLPVKKRLGLIRTEFVQVRKLANSSPAQYELQTKHLYSRLRDAYERMVEELIFCDVVRRGVDRVETQKLRYVHLSDVMAIRFNEGMTKANTFSHDNPASATVTIPKPAEVDADLDYFQKLMDDLKAENNATEAKRPSMKKK